MKPEVENAVRAQARQCAAEINAAMAAEPRPSWNRITPPILRKYHEKVQPLGVGLIEFISVIGRMHGRYGKG